MLNPTTEPGPAPPAPMAENLSWRNADAPSRPEALPKGLDSFALKCGKWIRRRFIFRGKWLRRAKRICRGEEPIKKLTEPELQQQLFAMRETFALGRENPADIDAAFALIREACFRITGMNPYPVQVAGALLIEHGLLAEMATGEGKTLTAVMPAVLAGWRGRGCHVMTSNNYLAKRDCEEMTPVYEFCGLKTAAISDDLPPPERDAAYHADITYCTNKDVAADFLRSALAGRNAHQSLIDALTGLPTKPGGGPRGLECCIIDEADSLLIDDAVIPLLISGEGESAGLDEAFMLAAATSKELLDKKHYTLDSQRRTVELTNPGRKLLKQKLAGEGGLWAASLRREEMILRALQAEHYFERDRQYIIDEEKVVIVDEATGRLMPDRVWRDGMHQAVEAKEGVELSPPKETQSRISFQNFFRLYKRMSGMTGTAREAAAEIDFYYDRRVLRLPTHRPCLRKNYFNRYYSGESGKYAAIVRETQKLHALGRPILIGTSSIHESEQLATHLREKGLTDLQVLNAVYHRDEAEIVSQAGQHAAITIATNMAGRGTDIKLDAKAKAAGGLHVIAAARFDSPRIDRQLTGRASRQGDPGSCRFFLSMGDDLLSSRFSKGLLKLVSPMCLLLPQPLRPLVAAPWFWLAQTLIVRRDRIRRRQVTTSDEKQEKMMGFARSEQGE